MAAKKKIAKKSVRRAPARDASQEILSALAASRKHAGFMTTMQSELDAAAQIREFIPTGIDVLDNYVIGRGGLPVGRMSEVFGDEGCGKTALLYKALGTCQKIGGVAALIDAEWSFDADRARVAGIKTSSLIMNDIKRGQIVLEDALEMIKALLRAHNPKNGPLLIGLDSIASLNTRSGISLEAGDAAVRGEAKILSDELRDLPALLKKHRAHLCMINQVRQKFGASRFGPQTTTPGGRAPAFYSSVRLQFFGGKGLKNKHEEHVGKVVTVVAVKNRLTAPFNKARVRFDYDSGYNNQWSTMEHAKRLGVLKARKKNKKGDADGPTYYQALNALEWDLGPGDDADTGSDQEVFEDDSADDVDAD